MSLHLVLFRFRFIFSRMFTVFTIALVNMKPFTFESQDLFEQLYYSLARDAREEFYIQTMEKD